MIEFYMKQSKKLLMRSLQYLLIVASTVSFSQLIYSNPTLSAAENLDRYWSVLTGNQQIPPVNTHGVGYVGLKFPDEMTWLAYTVTAENIRNVTGIYVYVGDRNQIGTIVLDLLKAEREHKSLDPKIVNMTSIKSCQNLN